MPLISALLMSITPAPPVMIALDGDTICAAWTRAACERRRRGAPRLPSERIRLLGIDTPETPGHCRRGRVCALGDPWKAKANLTRLLRARPITIEWLMKRDRRTGAIVKLRDRYRRPLVMVRAGGVDLSCAQLAAKAATYKPKWDNGHRVSNRCLHLTGQSAP